MFENKPISVIWLPRSPKSVELLEGMSRSTLTGSFQGSDDLLGVMRVRMPVFPMRMGVEEGMGVRMVTIPVLMVVVMSVACDPVPALGRLGTRWPLLQVAALTFALRRVGLVRRVRARWRHSNLYA